MAEVAETAVWPIPLLISLVLKDFSFIFILIDKNGFDVYQPLVN